MEPKRGVILPSDITKWEKSEAYQDILGFLMAMNESVKGKKLSCSCVQSDAVKSLSIILSKISSWIDEMPPVDQPQRYGNKAFRDFYAKLKENSLSELKEHLPEEHHSSVMEITPYFTEAFGNSTRIDYGTGHELSFIMFLCSLHKIGVLTREDSTATVTILFKQYLDLCRKLQATYKMEPAGSQGVWSLDDYQFVPFIWGSSQLMMHPKISPEMFTNEKVVEEYKDDYLFLSCIKYIMTVKTGPFAEHSNQLWNISGVQSWSKINQGLFKMYKAEILNKFPIIQHVLFGSILSLNPAKNIRFPPPSEMGAVKAGLGMMSRASCMTGMPPGPGRMPTPPGMMAHSMDRMPPGHGIMPPGPGRIPPGPGMMPPGPGIMPPGPGRMPPVPGIMPSGMERMPPGPGKMPPCPGVMPSGIESIPLDPGMIPPSTGKIGGDNTKMLHSDVILPKPDIEMAAQRIVDAIKPLPRPDIETSQTRPDNVLPCERLPSASAAKITSSICSNTADDNLKSDTNLDKSKLLNT